PFASGKIYEETLKTVNELGRAGVEKITLYKYTPLPYTAFEKIPPEERGVEEWIARLKAAVRRYNTMQKKEILGKHVEAFIIESGGRVYGYPVKHGPVIFLGRIARRGLNGCLVIVEVTGARYRYVKGRIVKIKECPPAS
ncbi:MAG: B12-binding domain-containing radical SAM protein, partial [Desulfurococcus sp.]